MTTISTYTQTRPAKRVPRRIKDDPAAVEAFLAEAGTIETEHTVYEGAVVDVRPYAEDRTQEQYTLDTGETFRLSTIGSLARMWAQRQMDEHTPTEDMRYDVIGIKVIVDSPSDDLTRVHKIAFTD